MMNIVLIAPPYPLTECPSPPLGLSYIAGVCEAAGAQVTILDYIVRRYTPEKLTAELKMIRPDIVGINSVTMNHKKAVEIIRTVKRHNQSIITVMGGPHVSYDYEKTLLNYPEIDIAVIGEGEQTITELLPVINQPDLWEQIKGVAFIRGGTVFLSQERPFIQNLDELPMPARHKLPISRYQALGFPVSIITSRGCPNQCIFCLGRQMVGPRVRYRSTVKIIDEIESILYYKFSFINIADDLFTSKEDHVAAFCDEIRRRKLKFKWSVFSRVNTINDHILALMKEAGCYAVSFGIESGNPAMLKRIKKGITLNQARKAAAACKSAGIRAHASFIVGLPGESEESLQDTKKLAQELNIEFGYHFLTPFPGVTIRNKLEQYDLTILSHDWNDYDANRAIVRTSQLSSQAMEAFVKSEYQRLNDSWDDLQQRYKQGNCDANERFTVENHYRMNMIYQLLSEDIIEHNGIFDLPVQDPLSALSDRISTLLNLNHTLVSRYLGLAHASAHIKYRQYDDKIQWFWTHNHLEEISPFDASAPLTLREESIKN